MNGTKQPFYADVPLRNYPLTCHIGRCFIYN